MSLLRAREGRPKRKANELHNLKSETLNRFFIINIFFFELKKLLFILFCNIFRKNAYF
jgi:hypothetical protein